MGPLNNMVTLIVAVYLMPERNNSEMHLDRFDFACEILHIYLKKLPSEAFSDSL